MNGPTLPHDLEARTTRHLAAVDRALPGRVVGFYLVGSVALGAYRPARSDIDYVAVVDGPLDRRELARLRACTLRRSALAASAALRHRRWALPGVFNGVYVDQASLPRPVSAIVPIAAHTAASFRTGSAFDVNPVVWKVFAERGVRLRGAEPSALDLDPEPAELRPWNERNLAGYWADWGRRTALLRGLHARIDPRWTTAWGVLGAPRLHRTITTGEVVAKEAAGEHALASFDERWHPLIREALAYWREEPADPAFADVRYRLRLTGSFVLEVVRSVPGSSPTAPSS